MANEFIDQGNVVSLSGTAILTTYVASTGLTYGDAETVRYTVKAVFAAASVITELVFKVQASADGTVWYDLPSHDDVTNEWSVGNNLKAVKGATIAHSISCAGSYENLRVAVKALGGVGIVGDTVTIDAERTAPPSSSLPSGGATATNQTTEIGHLAILSARATPGTTHTKSSVAASASSVTLQAANTARKGLYIRNTDVAPLYIRFGTGPATLADPLYLLQEQVYEMPKDLSTAIVLGIWITANGGTAEVEEIT